MRKLIRVWAQQRLRPFENACQKPEQSLLLLRRNAFQQQPFALQYETFDCVVGFKSLLSQRQELLAIVVEDVLSFFMDHAVLLSWLGGASLLMLVGSLIGVPLVIIQLPEDYLHREHKLARDWPPYLQPIVLPLRRRP